MSINIFNVQSIDSVFQCKLKTSPYIFDYSYEEKVYSSWSNCVDSIAQQNLNKPLILRDESKLISVNFDPEVR